MVIKKKYHGGLKLLLFLLFTMLLGMSSTCYANVTEDFVDGMMTQFGQTLTFSSYQTNHKNAFLNHTSNDVTTVTNLINTILENNNLSEISNYNIIFGVSYGSSSTGYIAFLISNNGAPGAIDNLDFSVFNSVGTSIKKYQNNMIDFIYRGSVTYHQTNGQFDSFTASSYFYKIDNYSQTQTSILGDNNTYWNYDSSTLTLKSPNVYGYGLPNVYVIQNNNTSPGFVANTNGNYVIPTPTPTPVPTPVPTPTVAPGGRDYTGQLTEIKDTISGEGKAIRDTISGESNKVISALTDVPTFSGDYISSGDITSQIDFSLLEENQELSRYSNFWYNFIDGLRSALTSNVRSINIEFRGQIYTINLDDFTLQLPSALKFILEKISIVFFVWLIIKWWKIIIDKISSGNIEEVLAMNEEEGIVDLF